ncbi:MAG: hypothetical protein Q9M92_15935 [Enterobacterales bacterium]|nr:hypothetical protein [Enterobacterales bacterium]
MTNSKFYFKANQSILWQLKEQLTVLRNSRDPIYRKTIPNIKGASIGSHVRHLLDFYQAFCLGLGRGMIDYDHRERNPETEQLLSKGLFQIEKVIEQLNEVSRFQSQPLLVKNSVTIEDSEDYLRSNQTRELQMLHSHTTHHLAIIGIILQLNQIEINAGFGKAPSTIRFENEKRIKSEQKKSSVSMAEETLKVFHRSTETA